MGLGRRISSLVARYLGLSDGTVLTVGAVSDGQVLTRSGNTITGAAAGGSIGGSTGSVDNALLRANGAGGSTVQAGAAAILTDNATLSLDGGANAIRLILDADAGQAKVLSWRTNDVQRFAIRVDGADDDAAFRRYDDAGAFVANAWAVDRSTGVMTVGELALTTPLAVAQGGTGSGTAAGAQTNLGIVPKSTLTTAAFPTTLAAAAVFANSSDPRGGVIFRANQAGGTSVKGYAATGTTVESIMSLVWDQTSTGYINTTVCLRESSSGKFVTMGAYYKGSVMTISADKFTNLTTFSANYAEVNLGTAMMTRLLGGATFAVRINVSGGNRIFQYDLDGSGWTTLHTVSETDFCTPDQRGITADPSLAAAGQAGLWLYTWGAAT